MNFKEILKTAEFSEKSTIELLAGDASSRKYYRVVSDGMFYILMHTEPFTLSDSNIVNQKILKDAGVRVPDFIKIIPEKGIIVEEDIGSFHLKDINNQDQLVSYYNEALSCMRKYQRLLSDISFTKEKFVSELEMSFEYYVKGYKNKNINNDEKLKLFYSDLVDEMMIQPNLFLHRDYHSRNIMIKNYEIVLIDFQDARMGPCTYDIASLAIDPYINIDDKFRDGLVNDYYDLVKDLIKITKEDYLKYYNLCTLQRGIKMLGTFAYQSIVKGKDQYLEYLPYTISRIAISSDKLTRWKSLVEEVYLR